MKRSENRRNTLRISPRRGLASLAFWGFGSLGLSALAFGPAPAEGQSLPTAPPAMSTSAQGEDLIVGLSWNDARPPEPLELVLLDEDDIPMTRELVWPDRDESLEVTFGSFLHQVPARGFQFSASLRESSGGSVLSPLKFRVALDCPTATGPCRWVTRDGLYTDALSTLPSLAHELEAQRASTSTDLLSDILAARPDLRGPILTLALQIDRLDQKIGLPLGCFCEWIHSSKSHPEERTCWKSGPGKTPDGRGYELGMATGKGPRSFVAGQARREPGTQEKAIQGLDSQTFTLSCLNIRGWLKSIPLPLTPSPQAPPRLVRTPILGICADSCRGTVESRASVFYRLGVHAKVYGWNQAPEAFVQASASLERSDQNGPLLSENPSHALVRWTPDGSSWLQKSGILELPSSGSYQDSGIRSLTAELKASTSLRLKTEDQGWSYGEAVIAWTRLHVDAQAPCSISEQRRAEVASKPRDCGEPLIAPWED